MKTVTTKSQLKKAVNDHEDKIIITGKLAKSMILAKKIATLGTVGIAILATALATAPVTGGLSFVAAAPIAASVGLETSVVIAVVAVGGVIIVLAICKDYNIKVTGKNAKGEAIELELTRK